MFKNPFPTVDIIIELQDLNKIGPILLIERKNPPYGWALPGGFVDYGEDLKTTAIREAKEETGLDINPITIIGIYSDPNRDPRQHNISTVFYAYTTQKPIAGDDAKNAKFFKLNELPILCFDHKKIINDYILWKNGKRTALYID